MNVRRLITLAVAVAIAPAIAHATIIFDNSSVASTKGATVPAGEDSVAIVTVSTPTVINQIGVLASLTGNRGGRGGNLQFLIFDEATSTLLFNSGPQFFSDDGFTFKLSDPFAPFTLLPGVTYDIGAISSVSAAYGFGDTGGATFTQNGITTDDVNGNALDYNNPKLSSQNGLVMVSLQLGQVPEPGTVALLGLGLAATALSLRKRRSTPA